jgi:signal transduction histidine kinase
LIIEDEGGSSDFFLPRSISQRAALNGGSVKVIPATAGGVRIKVEIPRARNL